MTTRYDEEGGNKSRWLGIRVLVIAAVLGATGILLNAASLKNVTAELINDLTYLGIATALLGFGLALGQQRKAVGRIVAAATRKEESAADPARSLAESVALTLEAATDRQEALATKFEQRLEWLLLVRVLLVLASVALPLLNLALYWRADTVALLSELQNLGFTRQEAIATATPDWRLLAAGTSLGLLFLAAARVLASTDAAVFKRTLRLRDEVRAYQELARWFEVARRLAAENGTEAGSVRHAATRVHEEIFERARCGERGSARTKK